MEPHADEWLAARWAEGDRAAMAALVRRYYQPLLSLFYRLTGRRSDAEDLVQETWLRAMRSLQEPRSIAVRPWLYRIAANLWRDQARMYIRRQAAGAVTEPLPDELELPAPDDVAGSVERAEAAHRVRAALLDLAPHHQEVVLLRYFQGLSYEEVAMAAGVPVGTVRSRLHHAVQSLRTRLHDLLPEGGETDAG